VEIPFLVVLLVEVVLPLEQSSVLALQIMAEMVVLPPLLVLVRLALLQAVAAVQLKQERPAAQVRAASFA
jgi:hypothetical protein